MVRAGETSVVDVQQGVIVRSSFTHFHGHARRKRAAIVQRQDSCRYASTDQELRGRRTSVELIRSHVPRQPPRGTRRGGPWHKTGGGDGGERSELGVNELETQSWIHMPGPVGRVGSNSVPPNSSFLLARAISKPSYRLLRQADALLQTDRPIESCLFSQRRQRWKMENMNVIFFFLFSLQTNLVAAGSQHTSTSSGSSLAAIIGRRTGT